MNVQRWEDAAKVFDTWRVIPRVVLGAYLIWAGQVLNYLYVWYTHLPVLERTTEASAFCIGVTTAVLGVSPFIFSIYSSNGRNWDSPSPASTTSTVVATTTTASGAP
jgi:hypothetical protein